MTILGIDPGVTGALVALDPATEQVIDYLPMPTTKIGKASRVSGAEVRAWIDKLPPITHVFIEQVHAMPGGGERRMGASSAFTFGHSAGYIEGVIAASRLPLTLIPPRQWKQFHGLNKADKDIARQRALQLYPNLDVLQKKSKGQAVADAILLGLYGMSMSPSRRSSSSEGAQDATLDTTR